MSATPSTSPADVQTASTLAVMTPPPTPGPTLTTPQAEPNPVLLLGLAALFLVALLMGLPPTHLVVVVIAVDALARARMNRLDRFPQ